MSASIQRPFLKHTSPGAASPVLAGNFWLLLAIDFAVATCIAISAILAIRMKIIS